MKTIETICQQLQSGELEVSAHALRRMLERNISEIEIRQAGENAIIIEDYPNDKYSPSCLLLGFTAEGKVLPGFWKGVRESKNYYPVGTGSKSVD